MARWSSQIPTWTPAAIANTTNLTNTNYHGFQGGTSTQRVNILEVYMGGQAGASSPTIMALARNSGAGGTPTAGNATFAAFDASTAALGTNPVSYQLTTTPPQRSSTLWLLNLSFNAFGGIVRWVAAPGEEIGILGNAATGGDVSLSAFTGGTPGLMGSHMVVEPFVSRGDCGGHAARSDWLYEMVGMLPDSTISEVDEIY